MFHKTSQIWFSDEQKGSISIGDNCYICGDLTSQGLGGNIVIGNNSFVGIGTRIWANQSIKIGNRVQISHNCNIFDSDTHPIDPDLRFQDWFNFRKGILKANENIQTKEIIIEDDALICANVTILKGVHIGKGAIVGTGSVVTKSIPDYAIAHGNPAKRKRYITSNEN